MAVNQTQTWRRRFPRPTGNTVARIDRQKTGTKPAALLAGIGLVISIRMASACGLGMHPLQMGLDGGSVLRVLSRLAPALHRAIPC